VLGQLVVEQALDVLSLSVGEESAGANGPPRALLGQRVSAAVAVGRPPAGDGFASDAEEIGEGGLGEAQFAAAQGAEAEGFENLAAEETTVGELNRHGSLLGRDAAHRIPTTCEQIPCRSNSTCPRPGTIGFGGTGSFVAIAAKPMPRNDSTRPPGAAPST